MTFPDGCVSDVIASPVGELTLVASARGLHALLWDVQNLHTPVERSPSHPILAAARRQLAEYFAGERREFDLPIHPDGTPFQLRAWAELSRIPYGETISYDTQARRLGDPRRARAVGAANGKNPISIIVPCHRVIAKSGALTGFGGGIERKRWLLDHERAHAKHGQLALGV
jgi:methylated-DNA-[protein]-cysteine S-methyltransferase